MLNINIPETSDNYFDEKNEMKTALKEWFEIENKRIFNEIKQNKMQGKQKCKKIYK